MVDLPDDLIEQLRLRAVVEAVARASYERGNPGVLWGEVEPLVRQDWLENARADLLIATPLIAARVRAEAVAEHRCPKDGGTFEEHFDRGFEAGKAEVAEAVAAERQRAAQLAQHAANVMVMLDRHPGLVGHLIDTDDNEGQRLRECLAELGVEPSAEVLSSMDELDRLAAGSVPVATPEPTVEIGGQKMTQAQLSGRATDMRARQDHEACLRLA